MPMPDKKHLRFAAAVHIHIQTSLPYIELSHRRCCLSVSRHRGLVPCIRHPSDTDLIPKITVTMRLAILASVLAAIDSALSHGDDPAREQLERRVFLEVHPTNNLDHCADKLKRSGLAQEAARRRYRRAASLMAAEDLHAVIRARQTSSVGKSHKSDKAYTAKTDPAVVFADSNSCVLSPQATEGPFCKC